MNLALAKTDWNRVLNEEFDKPYWKTLQDFLEAERSHHEIFPPTEKEFAALDLTPFESVKVVIVGQDPYHGPGQANGLCFSVGPDTKIPPSLRNIHKELETDLAISTAKSWFFRKLGQTGCAFIKHNAYCAGPPGSVTSETRLGNVHNQHHQSGRKQTNPSCFYSLGGFGSKKERLTGRHIASYNQLGSPISAFGPPRVFGFKTFF